MLDFILSKLNLLIMVTAIFAIVTYFSFFVDQSVIDRKAGQILSRFAEDTRTAVNSQNLCNQSTLSIPPYICALGCGNESKRIYFKVGISVIPRQGDSQNTLVYTLIEKQSNRIMAAQQYQMKANIRLFSSDVQTGSFIEDLTAPYKIDLDPQSAPPTDSILLIKEVFKGQETVFVVPCSSDSTSQNDFCTDNFDTLLNGKSGGFIGIKNEPGRAGVSNCDIKSN